MLRLTHKTIDAGAIVVNDAGTQLARREFALLPKSGADLGHGFVLIGP